MPHSLTSPEAAALIACAVRARDNAYAPYSRFRVGAAIVMDDDRVFVGCNVENASYGLSLCAERAALAAAVASGAKSLRAVAVVTDAGETGTPCGACRQWLHELGGPDAIVICASPNGEYRTYLIGELLPHPFEFDSRR